MKRILPLLMVLVLAIPLFAAVETWKNAPLVDSMCAARMKSKPDTHTAECALMCANSGLGILASDGTFLKFDGAGNEKAIAALKSTKKKDHIRATVTGERNGDTIQVQSISLH